MCIRILPRREKDKNVFTCNMTTDYTTNLLFQQTRRPAIMRYLSLAVKRNRIKVPPCNESEGDYPDLIGHCSQVGYSLFS